MTDRRGRAVTKQIMAGDQNNRPPLILASASPRRRQLMADAGYSFDVVEPPFSEPDAMGEQVPAAHQAEALSYFKARSVASQIDSGLIIAADTVVACQGRVYGKPLDVRDARRILMDLLGQRQEVITGITLLDAESGNRDIGHAVTVVWMRDVEPDQLNEYLDSGAWTGKAGAYGIQDRGDAFVERCEGSFTNVVGLPMELLSEKLSALGYEPETKQKQQEGPLPAS